MTLSETYHQIYQITIKLIELSLSVKENWPCRSGNEISCKEGADLSPILRNITYKEKYNLINSENNYNVKLLDGAVIQMMYRYNSTGRILASHRLAYFPAPNVENYEDNAELYENEYFGKSEFHDMIDQNVIKIPLRFDFSADVPPFIDFHHPYSHLHIGEYESCRIPVNRPLTPSHFINFILRNFYNTAIRDYCDDYSFPTQFNFNESITRTERGVIHVGLD